MFLRIISIEKIIFSGDVEVITFPGEDGSFTVLDHHAPLIATLVKGKIEYGKEGNKTSLDIEGGIAEVRNNRVAVVVS